MFSIFLWPKHCLFRHLFCRPYHLISVLPRSTSAICQHHSYSSILFHSFGIWVPISLLTPDSDMSMWMTQKLYPSSSNVLGLFISNVRQVNSSGTFIPMATGWTLSSTAASTRESWILATLSKNNLSLKSWSLRCYLHYTYHWPPGAL